MIFILPIVMSIIDYVKDYVSESEYQSEKNEAREQFTKSVADLWKISQTDWFNTIVEYRTREVDACEQRLRTMTSDNFKAVQSELNLAKRFLDWLEMLRNPPL